MGSIDLGLLSLAPGQVLLLIAFIVALVVGAIAGRRERTPVAGTLSDVLLVALASARLGFVVLYFEHYQGNLLGIIDIRDGGFHLVSGLVGCLAFAGYRLWRRPQLRYPLGLAMVAGLLSWSATWSLFRFMESQSRSLPEVAVTDWDGETRPLPEVAAGQPRVVNLWASWCPPCVREMPVLEKAADNHPGVAFVFVNQGEHRQTIREFLDRHGLNLEYVLLDTSGSVGRVTGNRMLPTTLFYDDSGRLVHVHRGGLSSATLARGLEAFAPQYRNGQTAPQEEG